MLYLRGTGLLVFAVALQAQSTVGGLRGVVTDTSAAVIPSATITLTGGGQQKTTVTKIDGGYAFAGIAPGQYALKVAYPGFAPFEKAVVIEAGPPSEFPIQLTVSLEKQTVAVSGEAGAKLSVDPDNNATAVLLKGADLEALPDDPGELGDMLQTLAGPAAGPNGGQIYVDGFSGGQLPPKNAIREIRINQNPFSAEYDRLGVGRIDILTKPGTDKLRGGIGYFDSEDEFNSRNPYAKNKANFANRYLNGNLSGPLGRRASFYLNFNHQTVDNDALIHAVALDPVTLTPSAVETSIVTPRGEYNLGPRIDYQLNAKNTLTGRYQYSFGTSDNNGIGQYTLLSNGYSSENRSQDLQLTDTTVLSPTAVNDLRFQYARNTSRNFGSNGVATVNVTDAFVGGGAQVGRSSNTSQRYEFQDNTSIAHRAHTFRFGARVRHETLSDDSPANFGGTFTFFGVAAAPLLDAANNAVLDPSTGLATTAPIGSLEQYRRTLLFQGMGLPAAQIRALGGGASQFSIAGGNPVASVSQTDMGVYGQDDWRVKPNLTVSVGLRYETQTNIDDWHDLSPRLGIAWAPKPQNGKPPKIVIRAGFGAYYDRVNSNLTLRQLRFDGVNQQQLLVVNPDFFPNVPALTALNAQKAPTNIYRLDPRLRTPYNLATVVSVERQLPRNTSLAATYLAMHGVHLLRTVNLNAPLPGTYDPANPASGLRPLGPTAGNLFQYESNGVFNQNMFFVSSNTRFHKSVSLNLAYGVMSANSDVDGIGLPSNSYNFKQDYGVANYQRRHRAQILGSLLAPYGVRFNPMIVVFSGAPYDLLIGHDLNGDTIANDRPAFATDLTRPSVVMTRFGAFDTNPLPGQTLVPRNYLVGNAMWNFNLRVGRTVAFGTVKRGATGVSGADPGIRGASASLAAQGPGGPGGGEKRFSLNFNVFVNNVFNHLNRGGWVGNLSSPLFGQSTSIYLQRQTSNDRMIQLGTQLSF